MIDLICATAFALTLSIPMTVGVGFLYYMFAVSMMNVCRWIWGESHKGYHFLNFAAFALVITFLLLFSFFARSLR
jgi:hypothetical protein